MSPVKNFTCPHCSTKIAVNIHAKGAAKGATKTAVGGFAVAVLYDFFPDLMSLGPNALILATWIAGQVCYGALSPEQWKSLLGD